MSADLRFKDGQPKIVYTDEASLRDGLAGLAYLAGWDVETEHHVVGWGRPDLYLRCDDRQVAVEIKLDLTRAATIRKAFQQADVYAKALGPDVEVILTAPLVDMALAEQYDLAYTEVWFMDTGFFWNWIHGTTVGMRQRHLTALARQRRIAEDLAISTAILRELSSFPGSSVGAHVAPAPASALYAQETQS